MSINRQTETICIEKIKGALNKIEDDHKIFMIKTAKTYLNMARAMKSKHYLTKAKEALEKAAKC